MCWARGDTGPTYSQSLSRRPPGENAQFPHLLPGRQFEAWHPDGCRTHHPRSKARRRLTALESLPHGYVGPFELPGEGVGVKEWVGIALTLKARSQVAEECGRFSELPGARFVAFKVIRDELVKTE